jgi:GTPase SAR1 family protein
MILSGNKVDLVQTDSSMRKVPYEDAKRFANANNLFFEETSALTCINVKEVFEVLLQEIYNEQSQYKQNTKKVKSNQLLKAQKSEKPSNCEC